MNNDDFYDTTKAFLSGFGDLSEAIENVDKKADRPKKVKQVLENIEEIAPSHARVLQEYIQVLESKLGAK